MAREALRIASSMEQDAPSAGTRRKSTLFSTDSEVHTYNVEEVAEEEDEETPEGVLGQSADGDTADQPRKLTSAQRTNLGSSGGQFSGVLAQVDRGYVVLEVYSYSSWCGAGTRRKPAQRQCSAPVCSTSMRYQCAVRASMQYQFAVPVRSTSTQYQ